MKTCVLTCAVPLSLGIAAGAGCNGAADSERVGEADLALDPSGVSFTLEGCRNNGSITLPNGSGQFVCPDSAYTTGNLGKGWNELDLVPYRLTASAGNSAPATQTYTVAVALDNEDAGHPGYDVLSTLTLNTALSSASCPATVGAQTVLAPGLGGIDKTIYRLVTITQPKNSTCVYDYFGRLALGSHLFPGSSLHANLTNENLGTAGVGSKDVSIPVKEIQPQSISKDMSATQDTDHVWSVTKSPTPATLTFGDTCDPAQPTSQGVQIQVTWTKGPATPSGGITVITHVYATNPASRVITTTVSDQIRSGTTVLDTASSGPIDVPANTANFLLLTHQTIVPAGSTNLNDIATATYTDKVTGVPVPGTTTATASATVQPSGSELNQSAIINDVENITGTGLTFSADSFSPLVGSFDNGYLAGTHTVGPVSWTSASQSGSGSVTFQKTVYVTSATQSNGTLSDTATLTGSNGFSTSAQANVNVSADFRVGVAIHKTIPNILTGTETATFTFHVKNSLNAIVASPTITFAAGETSKSVTVPNLAPGTYSVSEEPLAGWTTVSGDQPVDFSNKCLGTVSFANDSGPAQAIVQKVTVPAGFEANWSFTLFKGNTAVETVKTDASGIKAFTTPLEEGSYSIVEATQDGWTSDGGSSGCSFTVNLPADSGKTFSCTYTNTYGPSITLDKTGDALSKIGDTVHYTLALTNTSPIPAANSAGAPSLTCSIDDSTIGFHKSGVVLAPGGSDTSGPISFVIPQGALDPFINTATATCTFGTAASVTAQDSFSTNLFQPSIDVTKSGPASATVGQTITYTVTITNTSSSDSPALNLASFSDSLVPGVTPPPSCNTLATGASCSFSYTYVVQSTPNPLVNTATAHYNPDGFPNDITDSASVTTTVASGDTGQLAPTQTTCSQFISGTAADLTELQYGVNKQNKINNVAPGVFFYFTKIKAPATSFVVDILQTEDSNPPRLPLFNVAGVKPQISVYNASCVTTQATVGLVDGQPHISVTGATTGNDYIISVKYDTSSPVGQAVPNPTTVQYNFATLLNNNATPVASDSLLLKKKP